LYSAPSAIAKLLPGSNFLPRLNRAFRKKAGGKDGHFLYDH
jgi:hypothetical protein